MSLLPPMEKDYEMWQSIMNTDEQIQELNEQVRCTLRPSSIHGVGVFAIGNVKKGEKLYCLGTPNQKGYLIPTERLEEINKEVRDIIYARWPLAWEGSPFQSPNDDARLVSFMNHSPAPNYKDDYALRDILAGEEIVKNYDEIAPNIRL